MNKIFLKRKNKNDYDLSEYFANKYKNKIYVKIINKNHFEVQKTFDDMKSLYLTLNMSLGHIEYEYNRGSCGKLLTFLIIDKPWPTQA